MRLLRLLGIVITTVFLFLTIFTFFVIDLLIPVFNRRSFIGALVGAIIGVASTLYTSWDIFSWPVLGLAVMICAAIGGIVGMLLFPTERPIVGDICHDFASYKPTQPSQVLPWCADHPIKLVEVDGRWQLPDNRS